YVFYQMTLQCTLSGALPLAEIRMYSPHNKNPLCDCTIVNLFGRIFAPSQGKILTDAVLMVPYPGDPNNDDKYEASIIDNTTVKMWGIGTVLNNAKQWKDGLLRIFTLAISNYIRDK
ncbi:hypothetical protein K439DRAFT_1262227, partial [Ramaria rubella]